MEIDYTKIKPYQSSGTGQGRRQADQWCNEDTMNRCWHLEARELVLQGLQTTPSESMAEYLF